MIFYCNLYIKWSLIKPLIENLLYSNYYILAIRSKCMFLWLIDFPKLRQNLQLSGSPPLEPNSGSGDKHYPLLILVLVNLKVRARSGDPGSSFSYTAISSGYWGDFS